MTADDEKETIDYRQIPVPAPAEKPPTEFSALERRAELYKVIEEAGHPRNLERNQVDFAERYDVSESTISTDMKKIRQSMRDHFGQQVIEDTAFVGNNAVRKLQEREAYREAWNTQKEIMEMLFELGRLDREPQKHEFEGIDPQEAYKEMLRQAAEEGQQDDEWE